jgi:hypothetical protein
MKYSFLGVIILFCCCNPKIPYPEANKDSVAIANDLSRKNSIHDAQPVFEKMVILKLPDKTIHGTKFRFEIDSTSTDKYLEIFSGNDSLVKFYGSLFLHGSDRGINTGGYIEFWDEVGDYEIHKDTLLYFEYEVITKDYNGAKNSLANQESKVCVTKKTLLFKKDGTISVLKTQEGKIYDDLYNEVKKRLSKQISELKI